MLAKGSPASGKEQEKMDEKDREKPSKGCSESTELFKGERMIRK